MMGTITARLLRTGLALLLCLSMAGAALTSGVTPASAQESGDPPAIPGFDPLPAEAELLAYASGAFEGNGIATLLVERIALEPGATLDPVAGPLVVIVEQGGLVYEDDLGLEAEIGSGSAQFFAPGEGDTLSNPGDEETILVRTSLITDAPINGDPAPEDGGDPVDDDGAADEDEDAVDDSEDADMGPGEDTPIEPRGGGESAPGVGGINALLLQEGDVADEAVISLTEDGFSPDEVELVAGGVLVIENAGDIDCTFSIDGLEISIDLASGDIEQVEIAGDPGEYEWVCTDAEDNELGGGTLTVVGSSGDEESGDDLATPEADSDEGDSVADSGEPGTLLQASVEIDESGELFSASILLQPGGSLSLTGADGSLGIIVSGGDLTVVRPGRSPALLRDGRSVMLPTGTAAELTNNGDAPITVTLAGVTGSDLASSDSEATVTPEPETDSDSGETEDTGDEQVAESLYDLFPNDDEMAALGLLPIWNAFIDVVDPASNTFWYSDGASAAEALEPLNWLGSSELRYDSAGEETEFGQVDVFGILIDSFDDVDGAEGFFDYLSGDPTGESTDFLDGIDDVSGAIEFDLGTGTTETMIVAIQSGSFVITLFASGPELEVQALIREVAGLMFGVVG